MSENVKYFFSRFYDKMLEEDTFGNAAQVAFYFSFSIFPLLLFLISLFGLVLESADGFRFELFQYLRRIMPITAYDLVFHTIEEVMEKSSGGKITIGILIALWSASAGIDSLRGALNEVYRLKETRPFWKTRPLSILLTFAFGLLIFIALGVVFYGSQFVVWLLATINLPIPSPFFLGVLQWITVLSVLLLAFALVYNISPNHKPFRWQWITPGAIAGIILWLLVSNSFRIYLQYFDTYSKTYGSLGAMIILMLWLYLTALVILIGAVINCILEEIYDRIKLVETAEIISSNSSKTVAEKAEPAKIPASEIESAAESAKKFNRKTEISVKKLQSDKSYDEIESNSPRKKPIIEYTAAGIFVVMLGLMFRKKINRS